MRSKNKTTEPDATTPETPRVPLDKIHQHPANPRIDAVADEELVESVRVMGVLDPLMVAPHPTIPGEWTLLDGHRRTDAAHRAGVADVPVNPRYDLVTESQQLEVMIVTGLQKALLSPVEEAAGYEQLALLGMDEASIASATGFSVRRVKDRMKLNRLPAEARSKVHAGDATLTDLADLDEFADDPEATAQLVDALGTPNFRSHVHGLRAQRERAQRHRDRIAEFEDAGAKPWAPEDGEAVKWSYDTVVPLSWLAGEKRDPEFHDGCLGYYYQGATSYADPLIICTDAASHQDRGADAAKEAARAEQQAQADRAAAEREERIARRSAASAARLEWLTAYYAGLIPTKSHQPLATAARALLPLILTDTDEVAGDEALVVALGGSTTDRSYSGLERERAELAAMVAGATPTRVLEMFAGLLAAMTSDHLDAEPRFLSESGAARRVLDLWDWLKSAGYELSDVDREIRTELEVRHTDLTNDEGQDAPEAAADEEGAA